MGFAVLTIPGPNSSSRARYYSPVNVASVYGQYSRLSLAEKDGSTTAQFDVLSCIAFAVI